MAHHEVTPESYVTLVAAAPPDAVRVIVLAAGALRSAEQACRYHGQDFERHGMWCGEPRCESCRQPYRVVNALKAIEAWQERVGRHV